MGKRKERRHGAGRRVKLDLFAEPSGDLGGSPAEEGEGGVDTKLEAGLPKSPSSSGQQPANPLLLLGQYSDEDMEERSSDDHHDTTQAEIDEQIKANSKEVEELNVISSEENLPKSNELDVEKDVATSESSHGLGNIVTAESNAAASNDISHDKHLEPPQLPVPLASDIGATGNDANSCWKMVLHEESNTYYYWNTVTGETSWEVPPDLAQGPALVCEQQTSLAEDNSHKDMYTSSVTGSTNEDSYTLFPSASQIAQSIHESKGDESQLITGSGTMDAFHQENLPVGSFSSYVPPDVPVVGGWCPTSGASNIYSHLGVTYSQAETSVADLPSHLVRRSESLLDKLRSLKGSEDNSNARHAWTSKYISEIEIRLFDLQSLLSCGSSLASFWFHSETQLKRLEDAINNEIGSYVESELQNEINSAHLPSYEGKEAKQENREGESDMVEDLKNGVLSSSKSHIELDDVKLTFDVKSSALDEASCGGVSSIKQGPEVIPHTSQAREEDNTPNEATVHQNVNVDMKQEEDMDVDMEVEDTCLPIDATTTETVGNHAFPSEQHGQPSASADQQPLLSGSESFAPPPDDDWIPPPPPDSEEIPPPPPDDPPESSYVPPLPSYPEPVQTLAYPVSYGLTYTDPNYSYYGHAGATLPNQPVYYETVSSSHDAAPGTINNHVGSTVYYVQDATTPLVAAEVSSSYQVALAPSGYDTVSSKLAGTDGTQAQMASFQNPNVDVYALHGGAQPITSQAANTSIPAASSAATEESISASHASTTTSSTAPSAVSTVPDSSAAATATGKPQAKVPRVKKRTVAVSSSLRANKKVSSLVDKWKAAKEEMEEADEEDAENALMILEKKRQREIEEWRAQQIASGEARENANFQPLGGDWRERVKRKRAQKAASAEKTRVEETVAEKKQPSLTEPSTGLPPGWKAYWDESSKKVYYGNLITSETRWTLPT